MSGPLGPGAVPGVDGGSVLDLTQNAAGELAAPLAGVTVATPVLGDHYDPRPLEDRARRYIAYCLIALLWLLVIAIFVLISIGTIHVTDIKEFGVLVGPVVALVSAATGFYYGTKAT